LASCVLGDKRAVLEFVGRFRGVVVARGGGAVAAGEGFGLRGGVRYVCSRSLSWPKIGCGGDCPWRVGMRIPRFLAGGGTLWGSLIGSSGDEASWSGWGEGFVGGIVTSWLGVL